MKHTIIFPEKMFTEMKEHLLQNEKEQLASVLCGISKTENQVKFLCREVIKAGPEDLEYNSTTRVRAKKEYRKRILTRCLEENLHLIDCHSHPFSSADVDFSGIDDGNDFRTLTYISETIPGILCGCMVVGHNGFKARTLQPGKQLPCSHRRNNDHRPQTTKDNQRQLKNPITKLLTGRYSSSERRARRNCRETTVAIVGAGGTGSFVLADANQTGSGKD